MRYAPCALRIVFDQLYRDFPDTTFSTQNFSTMKKDIHPDYQKVTVELNDGTTYETRSTMDREHFKPEVDATNHPFYTGRKRRVSKTGRVERFMQKYGMTDEDESEEAEEAEEAEAAEATAESETEDETEEEE